MENYLKGWKEFANFSGKTNRQEFWTFILINMAITILLNFVGSAINFIFLSTIFNLITFIPTIAIWVRRMSDIGKEWYFMLIPFYNLYLAAQKGLEQEVSSAA